jgi:hypothetical protein
VSASCEVISALGRWPTRPLARYLSP